METSKYLIRTRNGVEIVKKTRYNIPRGHIRNITRDIEMMRSENVQLEALGYSYTGGQKKLPHEVHESRVDAINRRMNDFESIARLKPESKEVIRHRCMLALGSNFKNWSTLKRIYDHIIGTERVNLSDSNMIAIREMAKMMKHAGIYDMESERICLYLANKGAEKKAGEELDANFTMHRHTRWKALSDSISNIRHDLTILNYNKYRTLGLD